MKILAPFNSVSEVPLLIDAGADELYCGVWIEHRRRRKIPLNGRRYKFANLADFGGLREAADICTASGKDIFFCANVLYSSSCEIIEHIRNAIRCGVTGIIIADHSLIPFIKELRKDIKIIMSCLNPAFNSWNLKLFKEEGVDRVVLPRHLTLDEIGRLSHSASQYGIELEVFVLNMVCRHINGSCLFHKFIINRTAGFLSHFAKNTLRFLLNKRKKSRQFLYTYHPVHTQPCRYSYRAATVRKGGRRNIPRLQIDPDVFRYCGLCSLFLLKGYGIASVKIIGRGFVTEKKVKDVTLLRKYITLIEEGRMDKDTFIKRGEELYRLIYAGPCGHNECHHYEILQKRNRAAAQSS